MRILIDQHLRASIAVKAALLNNEPLLHHLEAAAKRAVEVFQGGGKLLFCGNGGSAADAQHLAAELSGRFGFDRPPLYAEALHVNTSYLTAVANDYSYEQVYARMVEAAGRPGDLLVALSTSGNSPNILAAAEKARALGLQVLAFTGQGGGKLAPLADYLIAVPSAETPRIQEAHITLGHILCDYVEQELFAR
jgi:D-sedoheptulose 7-phosphate isomerase